MVKLNQDMYTSSEKSLVRQKIINMAGKVECKNMLTLSGRYGVDAKLFANAFKCSHIVSLERDSQIFSLQQSELREYRNIICINTSTSYFLDNMLSKFPAFDCVFLDYNCIYTKDVEIDITNLFKSNNICRNTVFGITLVKGRDGQRLLQGTRLLNSVCCGNYHTYQVNRMSAISSTISQISRDYGAASKLFFKTTYKNKGRGASMMAMVFNVVNKKFGRN